LIKLSYRIRRILALLVLILGLPIYVVLAVTILDWLDRTSLIVELIIYVLLGILWALPLKFIFIGVGQKEP
jgi:hypothetical protein